MICFQKRMMSLKGLLVCLVTLTVISADKLRCRSCDHAEVLNDCHSIIECSSNEECYMDEIVTLSNIYYKGGCRAKDTCIGAGKRSLSLYEEGAKQTPRVKRNEELIACSRCCSRQSNTTDAPCNDRLCGLQRTAGSTLVPECYECDGVLNYHDCNSVTTCQRDEMCMASATLYSDNSTQYTFGCARKHPCLEGTAILVEGGNIVGKREHALAGCKICCGDNLCNTGDCKQLADKLTLLYRGGNLNLTTLKLM